MMTNICFFDIESTSRDALQAEIITAYFKCSEFDNYSFESQVDKWSYEAEEIHKISEIKMKSFDQKEIALKNLYEYLSSLPSNTIFVCYANTNQMGQFFHYDRAVIEMQLELHNYKFSMHNIISAHTMAKNAFKMGLFTPDKKNTSKGRTINDFTQSGVFYALFGYEFDGAHDCYNDVIALEKIYYELNDIIHNKRKSGNKQMELF